MYKSFLFDIAIGSNKNTVLELHPEFQQAFPFFETIHQPGIKYYY